MGFLKVFGKALEWEESKPYHHVVKENAVERIIEFVTANTTCYPKFGYEVEFHKIYIDDKNKRAQIDLSGEDDVINSNKIEEKEQIKDYHLQFEYGKWMIECKIR